ncbi:orexigenic neuropeptide QRFP [Platysternon megacephalum]|uniref:Aquaporin n=1 Tax=Platysternon megacephalum TaxID=55544 RepID=A0A4D9EBA1_9SAUR|nr:orexigenic neuropeptide QRFP [Platysternon megacephalum]
MAGLNVSIAFFLSVVAICEVIRQVSKRLLPLGVYHGLVRELVSSLQLCACCLELRMLMEIGPWGGGFGPDVILTLLFIIYLIHGVSFDGASANPTVSLQEFLVMDSSFVATAVKLLVQFVGMEAAGILTTHYWSWELTDFHLIQNLMALDCSSSIHTSLYHGIFVEGVCSFFFHLVALKFQHSHPLYRAPVLAVTVTTLAYTAGPFTGAFFNPTLASMVTFHCSGNILQEYVQVYWLGPLTGMLAALLLYQGNIPRLFQKNLLYSPKSKYRTPKGKAVPGLRQTGDNGEGQLQLRTKPRS